MKIVFFGNSKYSTIVAKILNDKFGLELVVTIPDRPMRSCIARTQSRAAPAASWISSISSAFLRVGLGGRCERQKAAPTPGSAWSGATRPSRSKMELCTLGVYQKPQ